MGGRLAVNPCQEAAAERKPLSMLYMQGEAPAQIKL